jgi:transcriptional regulator with XRE-family HTH domain
MEEMTDEQIKDNLAGNIRRQMELRDWSASDLARHSGVPNMTISSILGKKHIPKINTLKLIADTLCASMDALVGIEASANSSR